MQTENPTRTHWITQGVPRLFVDSVLLGVVGAFAAFSFMWLLHWAQKLLLVGIAGYHMPGLPQAGGAQKQVIGPHGLWFVPVVTTVGGLLSGLLVYGLAPECEGHGTDTVVRAFHLANGYMRKRVAPIKMLASAITIGSGGSAGREGPIALIGAGFGSVYATLQHRPEQERRLLILVGMAAGLSAIFRSPIGTALFAIEVLYGGLEFEGSALVYTLIGSMVAYAVNGALSGWQPLFRIPGLPVIQPIQYFWYAVLGLASGLVATVLPMVFFGLRDVFRALKIPQFTKPALGGLGVGLLALKFPQVLGGGYEGIQQAIDGHIIFKLLLALLFVKMLAFALTVSSGGSGGVFAPTLFVGAMLGGAVAAPLHQSATAFAVVGMAAVFGGAARIPIATLVMVMEMTGGYTLLGPAGLAVLLSYILQEQLSSHLKYKSLYEAQVAGRAQSPTHYAESVRVALSLIREHKLSANTQFNHINLLALLNAGIPIDLAGGRQLVAGSLRPNSTLVGKKVEGEFSPGDAANVEILALLNDNRVELVDPEATFEPGQRVLGVVSAKGRQVFRRHFDTSGQPATEPAKKALSTKERPLTH